MPPYTKRHLQGESTEIVQQYVEISILLRDVSSKHRYGAQAVHQQMQYGIKNCHKHFYSSFPAEFPQAESPITSIIIRKDILSFLIFSNLMVILVPYLIDEHNQQMFPNKIQFFTIILISALLYCAKPFMSYEFLTGNALP